MGKGSVLVTGASRGLGLAIASRLAAEGRRVGLVARDRTRGERAATQVENGELLVADLSLMAQVRGLAEEVRTKFPDLNVLINNAGVSKFARAVTEEGLEVTFATNHLAPFLLSNLLLDMLTANQAQIVNVSSEQHRFVRAIPWDDLQGERNFQPIERYSLTKLYNILFTRELARRTRDRGLLVNCLSPGFLRTDLGREATGAFKVFLALALPIRRPPDVGAEAVAHALDATTTGAYFRGKKEAPPSKLALDDAAATRLWEVSWKLGAHALEAAKLR